MIISAVRNEKEFEDALYSKSGIIFDLSPSVLDLAEKIKKTHKQGKKIFIHLDLADGIGKDRAGVSFVKVMGVDGIISTRANIIKFAHEENLFTVQRFFVVDSQSIATAIETVKSSKPDMVEIMPGVVDKVIKGMKEKTGVPVIAGGLIESYDEIKNALNAGATAISTGKKEFWG